jgi:hypothetical protein
LLALIVVKERKSFEKWGPVISEAFISFFMQVLESVGTTNKEERKTSHSLATLGLAPPLLL